jgi:hypothetical protein
MAVRESIEHQPASPHDGTETRTQFGIEAVSAVLGHSRISTSEIYAERSLKLATKVA